jgi:hypothetical protein
MNVKINYRIERRKKRRKKKKPVKIAGARIIKRRLSDSGKFDSSIRITNFNIANPVCMYEVLVSE